MITIWTNQSKSSNEATWGNTSLTWASILTWAQLFFFTNQIKH